MAAKLTTKEFIRRARLKHGNRYNYDKVVYTTAKEKVIITCTQHGEFEQSPTQHLRGNHCLKCSRISANNSINKGFTNFLKRSRCTHGMRYTYIESSYTKLHARVEVVCPDHGSFFQVASNHASGSGCPACKARNAGLRRLSTQDEFVAKAVGVHGLSYDYSKVEYRNSSSKILIICPQHGEFKQVASYHLSGNGCSKCGDVIKRFSTTGDTEEFVIAAAKLHLNTYDYSKVNYVKSKIKVTIICKEHGEFEQIPNDHLMGKGCPACKITSSKAEDSIAEFLEFTHGVIRRDRKVLKGKEIDILVDCGIGIEYNGRYWHSERVHSNPKWHMQEKQALAAERGVRLIHICDTEDLVIVKKTLAHILGIDDERIFARKCNVGCGRSDDVKIKEFFNHNHLQGAVSGCEVKYLSLNGQIVCAMAFSMASSERGNSDSGRWELRRFASVCRVVGGASRLLKAFIRTAVGCESIISYSDNRWFTGGMYEQLGFSFIHEVAPDYKYTKGRLLQHKGRFQRSQLAKRDDIDFRPEETEVKNANRNGWFRIWDCGKKKWELKL